MKCEYVPIPSADGRFWCRHCHNIQNKPIHRDCQPFEEDGKRQSISDQSNCLWRRGLSRTAECSSCNGSTMQIPVYRCHIYGECTERDHDIRRQLVIGKETIALESKVQSCEGCEFFEARGGLQEPKPNKSEAETDSPEPGLLKAAGNFVKSATKHVAAGMRHVTNEERQRRLEICKGCERLSAEKQQCRKCGCFVKIKTKWAKEKCPVGKW